MINSYETSEPYIKFKTAMETEGSNVKKLFDNCLENSTEVNDPIITDAYMTVLKKLGVEFAQVFSYEINKALELKHDKNYTPPGRPSNRDILTAKIGHKGAKDITDYDYDENTLKEINHLLQIGIFKEPLLMCIGATLNGELMTIDQMKNFVTDYNNTKGAMLKLKMKWGYEYGKD
jgi:hypothetical protein